MMISVVSLFHTIITTKIESQTVYILIYSAKTPYNNDDRACNLNVVFLVHT